MKIDVLNLNGDIVDYFQSEILSMKVDKFVVSAVTRYGLLVSRTATAKTKNRSRVAGSGKKRIQQKKTGRARMGERNPVHHRGGSVAFGPNGRLYNLSLNKKMRRKALYMTLSDKASNGKLLIIDNFQMEDNKTKSFCKVLDTLKLSNKVLFVDTPSNIISIRDISPDNKTKFQNFALSMRNLFKCKLRSIYTMNLKSIIDSDSVVFSLNAINELIGGKNE